MRPFVLSMAEEMAVYHIEFESVILTCLDDSTAIHKIQQIKKVLAFEVSNKGPAIILLNLDCGHSLKYP